MDTKLTQLESIKNDVKGINWRIDKIDQKIKNIEGKVKDLEESKNFDAGLFEDMANKQREINSILSKMKKFETEQKERERKLQDEVTDLKCRSMRDNLMFYNLQEENGENCEEKVLSFIENRLGIERATTDIKLHRAHRKGTFKRGNTRPIVAKFTNYPDREKVRKAAKNLKGTEFGIS